MRLRRLKVGFRPGDNPSTMLPSMPWLPVRGAVDTIASLRNRHHVAHEAIAGRPAFASGWLLDTRDLDAPRPVEAAWLVVGDDAALPLTLDRQRPDVDASLRIEPSLTGMPIGFEGEVQLPLCAGKRRCRIVARAADGAGLVGDSALDLLMALPPLEEGPAHDDAVLEVEASLALRDSVSIHWTHDRGPFSVRASGSMVVFGKVAAEHPILRIEGAGVERWFALDTPHNGRAGGGVSFRTFLATDELPIAGYEATLFAGTPARPVLSVRFELADEHRFLPEALMRFRQPAIGRIADLLRAAPTSPGSSRELVAGRVSRGEPLWVGGTGCDPAGGPLIATYAQIDDRRPIPIPRWTRPDGTTAFGGIVDTARLEGGEHQLQIFAVASLGNGYYGLGGRRFVIDDEQHYAPLAD